MLLLKNERKLLKILRKNSPDYDRNVFSYYYLEKNFYQNDSEELYTTVRSLSTKEPKLIGIAKNQDNISLGIYLENTGIHFYEFLSIKLITAFLCYIAGILTALAPNIFELILKLFENTLG